MVRAVGHQAGEPEAADPAVVDLAAHGLRAWGLMTVRVSRMSSRPPNLEIRALLALAFSCLRRGYRADPIVIDQAVYAGRALGGQDAARYVNALLRRLLREPDDAARDEWHLTALSNTPAWLLRRLSHAGANTLGAYSAVAGTPPAFALRYTGGEDEKHRWERALHEKGFTCTWVTARGLILSPAAPVAQLPGFEEGLFRVQDLSAQQTFGLLDLKAGDRVLDACAAPGGKTFLLTEQAPVEVWAADQSPLRLRRLSQEWMRLSHLFPQSRVMPVVADMTASIWPAALPTEFDHIVLDAPCSGTGVVRRHPEIPWSRSEQSLADLTRVQAALLQRVWPALRPGGQLLYITCSVLPEEGEEQIQKFLADAADAIRLPAPGQILPYHVVTEERRQAGDGFFYARLQKRLDNPQCLDDSFCAPVHGSSS